MMHARTASRKVPKWLLTPGLFVLFAVFAGSVPSVRAPFEDYAPTTQEVVQGYANGSFPMNLSLSDDARISIQAVNDSAVFGFSEAWVWQFLIWYNWTAIDSDGTAWQLLMECDPPIPASNFSTFPLRVLIIELPDIVDAECPYPYGGALSVTIDLIGFSGGNLTTAMLAGFIVCTPTSNYPTGCPQMETDFTWLLDQYVVRRIYTIAGPPAPPSPLLDWMLILLLLILWVSFSAIGAAKSSGLLFMGGALCGIVLAFFYVLPISELPGIAVLGLAMTCMLGGVAIAISPGGEAG